MSARWRHLIQDVQQRPRRLLALAVVLAAVAAVGFGGYRLGAAYWADREYNDALQAARTARRAGHLDEAGQELEKCARLRPAAPDLALEQALLRAQGGDLKDQDVILNAHLAADDPDLPLLRQSLRRHAEKAMDRGDFLAAYTQLGFCLQLAPNDAAVQFLAARCTRRGQAYERAKQHLAACERLTGPTPALHLEQVLLRAQQGHYASDEAYLRSLVDADHPDSVLILEALTQGYMQNSEFTSAVVCIEKWLLLQPKAVQAYRWRAKIRKRLRDYDAALDDYAYALKLDPRHDPTRLDLAEMLLTLHHLPEARGHLEQLYQRTPNNPKVLLGLAVCERNAGHIHEAQRLLDRLAEKDSDNFLVLTERARVALALQNPVEAEGFVLRALKIAPRNLQVYELLHRALMGRDEKRDREALATWKRLDKAEEELRDLRKQIGKKPHDLDLRRRIGLLCLETGKDEEGAFWLEGVLREDPKRRDLHEILADHYTEVGQRDKAAKHRRLAREAGAAGPKR